MSQIPDSSQQTFRLGLSLAGCVSAGAYAAGVLDYLVQALDAWEARRARNDPAAPQHVVILDAIAGASAGAYAASLLAVGLRSRFPHVSLSSYDDPPDWRKNQLHAAWVRGTGVLDLLKNRDCADRSYTAFLDATWITEVASEAFATPALLDPFEENGRAWVADPLRLAFTVTHLGGVPFRFEGTRLPSSISCVRQYADVARFALAGLGSAPGLPAGPDELRLQYPSDAAALPQQWQRLEHAATASAAFPFIFPPHVVPWFTAAYRPLRVPWPPGVSGPPHARFWPMWTEPVPTHFSYLGVDGGILDNDPVDIVGDDLRGRDAGTPRQAERHGADTDRGVLMIHPLREKNSPDSIQSVPEQHPCPPHRLLARLVDAIWMQARVKLVDFALAQREDCYSRFLIAPGRTGAAGGPALAGACLGAFGGYLHADYRRHDWQLGRSNARDALQRHLTLPAGHALFSEWTDDQRRDFCVSGPDGDELPIIPLMPELLEAHETPLPWPGQRDSTADLGKPLDARLLIVLKGLSRLYLPRCWGGHFLLRVLWWAGLGRAVRRRLLGAMRKALAANGL